MITTKEPGKYFPKGALTLPLTIMLPLGLIGFRPGQLFNRTIGCLFNLMFVLNYILVFIVGVGHLEIQKDYSSTYHIFYAGFVILMIIKFNLLAYNYYKRYNVMCLLGDLMRLHKHSLTKLEILLLTVTFIEFLGLMTYIFFFLFSGVVLPVLRTGTSNPFAFKTTSPIGTKVVAVFEYIIFLNITWISILATSFLVNIIAVVLGREFHKCFENLQEKINETGTLSGDIFSETMESFTALRNMVQKADDMVSPIICLNLTLSLGMLCGAIYALSNGEGTFFEGWQIGVSFSLGTIIILLIHTSELHNKVKQFITLLIILCSS